MSGTIHPITAGDGYAYLSRQVATGDGTELGRSTLNDYYSERGEQPGVWIGSGLPQLPGPFGLVEGDTVTEDQMKALFGEGLHPNADMITRAETDAGRGAPAALAATRLGKPFDVKTGASEFRVEVAKRFDEYNKSVGEKWNAPIPADVRARVRSEVSTLLFTREFGRAPLDERELSGWTAQKSRQRTTDVAAFDLTFTPPKSVSVLWALAPRDISKIIEDCHDAAVRDTIKWMESNAFFSRIGAGGVGQVDVDGVIAAAFKHRDSRAGDPNLHTHVPVSNVVPVTMPDGSRRWLRLDSQTLHKMTVAMSEYYNTRDQLRMMAALPVAYVARAGGGKEPVMELAGADLALCDGFSQRSKVINRRVAELSREFQATHGREPTPVESLDLAQRANLETRQAKHDPKSHEDQRAEWASFAAARGVDVEALVAGQLSAPVTKFEVSDGWLDAQAESVRVSLTESRARWGRNHLEAEVHRRVRFGGVPLELHETVAAALFERTVAGSVRLAAPPLSADGLEPGVLRRKDGGSLYHRFLGDLHTTQAMLDAENRVVGVAGFPGREAVFAAVG